MPEYLAPGVYIEETSFRSKTIEGVSTSIAGFVGPTRFGPTKGVPELLTSFADFERIYGGIDPLEFDGKKMDNYMAHAVRAFFENGGKRLYVSRLYKEKTDTNKKSNSGDTETKESDGNRVAHKEIKSNNTTIELKARYPGTYGKIIATFVLRTGVNILIQDAKLKSVKEDDVVLVEKPTKQYEIYVLKKESDDNFRLCKDEKDFRLKKVNEQPNEKQPNEKQPNEEQPNEEQPNEEQPNEEQPTEEQPTEEQPTEELEAIKVYIVSVNVTLKPDGKFTNAHTWENLSLHPEHKNSLKNVFPKETQDRSIRLYNPLIFETEAKNGVKIAETLLSHDKKENLEPGKSIKKKITLEGGSDGDYPWGEYKGDENKKSGLKAFEDIEDISIVAAPGATHTHEKKDEENVQTVLNDLIDHCENMHYRIAVLDSVQNHSISEVREYRNQFDSKHAALYYPWVTVLDPATEEVINLPPSGFVAGIYARNDIEYGVHKAPANEIVNLAIDFEFRLNKAQQGVLNPEGINCFRFFEGRGYRLWGARTISSDPEWKYVNLRRYFAFLERSIEKGTQWVVFENNSERLWSKVRITIEDFLYNEWKSGHLMGETAKMAYFVRCDRSTITQNDYDNGRLICHIGVAPVRPAEFVIFQIGQWTADRKV